MPTKFYHHLFIYYFIVFVNIYINCFHSEDDNSLLDVPEINCFADTIEMRFKTKRRFEGKIYVQGHYDNPNCRVDYSKTSADGNPIGGIRLQHGSCDMDRQRMVQPEGMQFSTVLVISFHRLFVTKADRAFHINCMYRETVKDVTAGLTVEGITPQSIAYDMPMPQCTYTIRKDELNGDVLKYARVGDQVVHVWECLSDTYGMLVHSCYAEDGQGDKKLVIDEKGCHTDHQILGDPTYTKDLNLAYRESYVFKFADRVGMRFSCEIKLCIKDGGGCNDITPPNCGADFQKDNYLSNNDEHEEEETTTKDNWHTETNSINIPQVNETSSYLVTSTEPLTTASLTILNKLKNEIRLSREEIASKKKRRSLLDSSLSLNNQSDIKHSSLAFLKNTANKTVSADLFSQYVYVLDAEDEEQKIRKTDTSSDNVLESLKSKRLSAQFAATTSVCLSQGIFIAVVFGVAGLFAFAAVLLFNLLLRYELRSKMSMRIQRQSQINPLSFVFK